MSTDDAPGRVWEQTWNGDRMIPVVTDPVKAAEMLRDGQVIDYQPGDGTRYEVQVVKTGPFQHVLLMHNFGCFVRQPDTGDLIGVNSWSTKAAYPSGVWGGMRPLLAALGWAKGKTRMLSADSHDEAAARTRPNGDNERTTPAQDAKDARLGRRVRRLLEAE